MTPAERKAYAEVAALFGKAGEYAAQGLALPADVREPIEYLLLLAA